MSDILSIDQVAELLDCTTQTVAERTLAGDLPGVKFGRSWRYPRQALIDRLNAIALRPPARPEPSAVMRQIPEKKRPALPVV